MTDDTNATQSTESEEVTDYAHMAEELGYKMCDWSRLDDAEIDRHDAVLDWEPDQLRSLDLGEESDLIKWAAAQAWGDLDDDGMFQEIALSIVHSREPHPAVDYAEIAVELTNDLILEGEWERAVELLDHLDRLVPEDTSVRQRYEATIMILKGDTDAGLAAMQALLDNAGDDAGLVLAVAEDLIACDLIDEARPVLDKAEELARTDNDQGMIEDVMEARDFLAQIEAGEEE